MMMFLEHWDSAQDGRTVDPWTFSATIRRLFSTSNLDRCGLGIFRLFGFLVGFVAMLWPGAGLGAGTNESASELIVVTGAAGERDYGEMFATWAMRLQEGAKRAEVNFTLVGQGRMEGGDDKELLRAALEKVSRQSTEPLWLVLIGHGTYNGKTAKLNLRGPDVSAAELADWLHPLSRPVVVVNCTASSAPFINRLKGRDRVIVTATKSGTEKNFARFGDYFTAGIADPEADLDKDGQTSLLEAFLRAAKDVQAYYSENGRLATEHALLDDNGDGLGSRAEWFRGVRAVKKPAGKAEIDGFRAHQLHLVRSELEKRLTSQERAERDRLELALDRHRERKSRMKEKLYYSQLEKIVIQIARIYERAEARLAGSEEPKPEATSAGR